MTARRWLLSPRRLDLLLERGRCRLGFLVEAIDELCESSLRRGVVLETGLEGDAQLVPCP